MDCERVLTEYYRVRCTPYGIQRSKIPTFFGVFGVLALIGRAEKAGELGLLIVARSGCEIDERAGIVSTAYLPSGE